ncbi:hypothetical protein L1887_57647 [Cichorium endivia]|nr:hypothetical protein L1887_57647 [Cichorium endivia]
MQLKFHTTQHDIKVEIKEEVVDIHEVDQNPSQDYVQESTSFKADPPKMDGCFHHRSTPYLKKDYAGLKAICSSMKSTRPALYWKVTSQKGIVLNLPTHLRSKGHRHRDPLPHADALSRSSKARARLARASSTAVRQRRHLRGHRVLEPLAHAGVPSKHILPFPRGAPDG